MKYKNIVVGKFVYRENRFIAQCEVKGKIERAHVRNTGRCAELLVPGVVAYLQYAPADNRKTEYTLLAVQKGNKTVNLDSLAPNRLVLEYLRDGGILPGMEQPASHLQGEIKYGDSRLDFAFLSGRKQAYAEVKGVTLEREGVAYFPDAPTLRGIRHMRELCRAKIEGALAYLILVIQMEGILSFAPNYATHPEFAAALKEAKQQGVTILALGCRVFGDGLELAQRVPVNLEDRSSLLWKQ